MRNPETILSNICKHSSDKNYRYERLYRNLFNEQMFYVAYQRIYAKPGNMTPGTDGQTIDQMSLQRIDGIINSLKDESYSPKPVRRVYIPKKNGKLRPLGVPTFDDKLVQEVVRMILEAIYEGYFEDTSHGFRPRRSCHTALKNIRYVFTGAKWFIEGDIKGFFDNIDHDVLIQILSERIEDERFLRLIRKFLKAGYLEQWTYHNTYSGTPQGGIISPLLANIYLDVFDKYMKEYRDKFKKGIKRRWTREYRDKNVDVERIRRHIIRCKDDAERNDLIQEYRNARKIKLHTMCGDPMDETYRRLQYVRYADDFLIGVIGTKAECVQIKAEITQFMSDRLKLELSAEKTLITNAQDDAKFLGYEICCRPSDRVLKYADGSSQRSYNNRIILKLPKEAVEHKLLEYEAMIIKSQGSKRIWWPVARKQLLNQEPHKILALVNGEIRGFYRYYSLAENIGGIGNHFGYVMKYSFYKTLARKYRSSVGQIKDKYRKGNNFIIPYKNEQGKMKHVILYNDGFSRQDANTRSYIDLIPTDVMDVPYPTITERLMERTCELCGKEDENLYMHHVRKLTLLKGEVEWEKLMLQRRRKTLAVCESCLQRIHNYVNNTCQTTMESRIHGDG